jgi:uncharacterized protein YacL
MSFEFIIRLIGMFLGGLMGWEAGSFLVEKVQPDPPVLRYTVAISLAGAGLGLLLMPYFTTRPFSWLIKRIRHIAAHRLIAAVVGLIVGLIISALLALPISLLPGMFGEVLPFGVAVAFAVLGIEVMVTREKDIFDTVGMRLSREGLVSRERRILLDTSVIIDGRISDISQTGFINGTLIVPQFVLDELQHIADSSDTLRRNRGRRGLEVLNGLQKDASVPIEISDVDAPDVQEVDSKLVKLARDLDCPVMTNDFNLNRVAELQGVQILNINELANAVKAIVLPGETISVQIIQEGKDAGQGVGYLEDGTMVVVENGFRYLNQKIDVVVTRVLQTVAGRMIFAQPQG